jgi:glycine betaine catabolism A
MVTGLLYAETMFTLPRQFYTDEAVFREEMERLFVNAWVCAGRVESIERPGDFFLADVAGESVIVTRTPEGRVAAYYNVCRHRGTRLCTEPSGRFDGKVQCPYHGWSYTLEGRLAGAPHMDDASFQRADYGLHKVATGVWDGHVFLHLGAEAASFDDHVRELREKFSPWGMSDLRLGKRIVYDVRANWKLLVLNYNECLHCPLLHPELNRLTDYLGADNEKPSETHIGGCMGFRDGAETMSVDGRRRRAYLPGLGERERSLVAYYAVYPNLLLSLHPDYMMLHRLWPKTVDRTEVVCEWHFQPGEMEQPGFVWEDAVEFWDTTNRQDWRISELSQKGIESRAYTPGPYSPRESLLHAFDRWVTARVKPHGPSR